MFQISAPSARSDYSAHIGILGDACASLEVLTGMARAKLGAARKSYPDWISRMRERGSLSQGRFNPL